MKPVIYQILPRLFTNTNKTCRPAGTYAENGSGKFNDITPEILKSIKELGVTHLWLTGAIEHATKTDYSEFGIKPDHKAIVKGEAGSPYAIKDYYDVDPDLAVDVENRMAEFEDLVKRIHEAGMKVIIDFVPNHVAREYHSDKRPAGVDDLGAHDDNSLYFGHNNNFYYIPRQLFAPHINLEAGDGPYIEFPAKATGNDCFNAFPGVNDWYETVKLNYGVDYGDGTRHFDPIPDTWYKMLHILRFWASKDIDAFRCDMAHMVPVEFWEWAIPAVRRQYPRVKFIAEIYDVGLYRDYIFRGGFDYLYDKVNLYDTLRAIQCYNYSAAQLTNCWQTIEGIQKNMLNFLENHDEQRFGSKQYSGDPSLVLPSLAVSALMSTGPMMIYMGQELGEQANDAEGFSGADGRTTIFDYWSLKTLRNWLSDVTNLTGLSPREKKLRETYAKILNLCNSEKAIAEGGFFDLMYVNYDNPRFNPHRQYAFIRNSGATVILVVVNFADTKATVDVNIPLHAFDVLSLPTAAMTTATDLLTGEKMRIPFNTDTPVTVEIEPYGATVLKFALRRQKTAKKS